VVTDSESPKRLEVIESSRLEAIAELCRPAKAEMLDVGLSSTRE